jgi:nicotinate-nucleotide adenylyltransferase
MKIALLGGTFNPVHNGHIVLGEIVKNSFNYDKIIFVPSYIPAHKEVSGSIGADERLHMLKLAIRDLEWADYSDCEIQRKGISYTYDTLRYMKEYYHLPQKPGLIIGDDLAGSFNSWRNPQLILEMADLIIAHRLHEEEVFLNFPHKYINNPIYTLSSSQIRSLLQSGEDIDGVLPEAVAKYILERDLYREQTGNY